MGIPYELVFHRWEREEDSFSFICKAPPQPRGPSYGTQPGVCLGDCGARVLDLEIDGVELAAWSGGRMDRMTLDVIWELKQRGVIDTPAPDVPELFRLRWLVSEMLGEIEHPSGRVSGTKDGWQAFVTDWAKRAKAQLLAADRAKREGVSPM